MRDVVSDERLGCRRAELSKVTLLFGAEPDEAGMKLRGEAAVETSGAHRTLDACALFRFDEREIGLRHSGLCSSFRGGAQSR
nr:hypothetical protein [Rhodovibrio sodomensis]